MLNKYIVYRATIEKGNKEPAVNWPLFSLEKSSSLREAVCQAMNAKNDSSAINLVNAGKGTSNGTHVWAVYQSDSHFYFVEQRPWACYSK